MTTRICRLIPLFGLLGMAEVVDAFVVLDRETGNSRGFGKVAFETPEGHSRAIEILDGYL